jgi:ribosome biogenesis GTPase
MMQGQIVRCVGGLYAVQCGAETIQCRARGKFRWEGVTPLVGDHAEVTKLIDGSGRLDRLLPSSSRFVRPPVANIDALIMVAAGITPRTDPYLADKMAVAAEQAGARFALCVNKMDLAEHEVLCRAYELAGYPVFRVSAVTREGLPEFGGFLAGKLVAFTGNSGVGKSTLLSALCPGLNLAAGEVSVKLGRGRHTTRHVEIFTLPAGARVADTPGFSVFETGQDILPEALGGLFPEFRPHLGRCRFTGCLHVGVMDCAVGEALAEGKIAPSRYESYKRLLDEAKERKPWETQRS